VVERDAYELRRGRGPRRDAGPIRQQASHAGGERPAGSGRTDLRASALLDSVCSDELVSVRGVDVDRVQAGSITVDVNSVGACAVCSDSSSDVDSVDATVELDADHVLTGGADLATDGDRADLGAGLDAQRDRLERHLNALDEALAFAAAGAEVTGDLEDREGL
jgi:hypothetical protein